MRRFVVAIAPIIIGRMVWLTLVSVLIEARCPKHGLERFKVKIIRRFNIAHDQITPKITKKPIRGEISLLYVGRDVSNDEAKSYLIDYFREKGMMERIIQIRMMV